MRDMMQVRCLECGHVSATYDTHVSLSLDLARHATLEDCLAAFTAPEILVCVCGCVFCVWGVNLFTEKRNKRLR